MHFCSAVEALAKNPVKTLSGAFLGVQKCSFLYFFFFFFLECYSVIEKRRKIHFSLLDRDKTMPRWK